MENRFFYRLTSGVFFLFSLFTYQQGNAQAGNGVSLRAIVDRNRILLGEQLQLTINLEYSKAKNQVKWMIVPDSLNHLEVLERGSVDSTQRDGKTRISQTLVLTGFDSGHWVIPSFAVTIDKRSFRTDTIGIDILPAKLKGQDYHDIKEIIEVPKQESNWKLWIALALSVVLLGALAWHYLNKPKKSPAVSEFGTKLSPHDHALREMKKLKEEKILEKGEVKLYYSRLYDIYRVYLQRQFGIPVLQGTTDELLIRVKENKLPQDHFSKLAESLRMADATKFAKYIPSVDQGNKSYQVIHDSIQFLHQQQKG